ncbi:MAG TPA: tRNA epoxyqueuosine(34) reductase QueG [Vicinamibacteria bacterium]|nr:tRNA epoxyqueuosine(34) reductase QueG [Vicinamibacteria bacterium]
MNPEALAARVKTLAREAGFDLVGIASADAPPELAAFARWAARGLAGEMGYLTAQVERRSDLRAAFPWARSVVCLGVQYDTPFPYSTEADPQSGWIARYAWGDDYHDVLRAMLERLQAALEKDVGPLRARAYADTGPIVERVYAAAAGLGAWGKNTCLLHPDHGSWFFLGEAVTDLPLVPDTPRPDMCGTCTACLDACPTGALPAPYELDATRCISYLTIEVKGAIPEDRREGLGRHVFGCDICQDVCPWNRKRRHRGGVSFEAREGLVAPDLARLAGLSDEAFRETFRHSPVKRAKRRGLLRNVAVALGNSGDPARRPILDRLAADEDPLVREHARWALARLDRSPPPAAGRTPDGPRS